MPNCLYCRHEINENNSHSFRFRGLWFCSQDCWRAMGLCSWRKFRNIPHDPDQLDIVEPHDPIWDVERWMKKPTPLSLIKEK